MGNLINTILLGGAFLALFASAELLYHYFKVKAELTRKYVHLFTGVITLLFPLLLSVHWYVLFLCLTFALILLVSQKYNLLKSINAIDRKSFGSICYPVSVYGCFIAFINYHSLCFFYLPILTLAIADPVAALTGKKWPYGKYHILGESKTVVGSMMFFITAFVISVICLKYTTSCDLTLMITTSLLLAFASSIVEALTKHGLDNITIPLSVLVILLVINYKHALI